MISKLVKKVPVSLAISVAFLLAFSLYAIAMNIAAMPYPVFQKGMSYVTWSREGFTGKKSDESVKSMAEAGINYVAIVATWYQQTYNSVEITPNDRSPSDASVRHVIRLAHELGMAVLLKPHIDLISSNDGSSSRGDIGFVTEEKWKQWCENYVNFITHYAALAKEEGVEAFCVGTELSFASTRTGMWRDVIIPAVRKAYPGRITYASNWDEYNTVEFWGELDYAGVDAYFPLVRKSNPSFEEIKEGWGKWIGELETWQKRVNKPVIFTECGYCSSGNTAKKPWEEAMSGEADMKAQADCYRALFEAFWDKPWFCGVYWWSWNTYPGSGGENHKGFTPQNKLALDCLKEWYAKPVNEKIFAAVKPVNMADAGLGERMKMAGMLEQEQVRGIPFIGEPAGKKKYAGREE